MKKTILILTLIFIIVICSAIGLVINNNNRANELRIYNIQYEQYLNKELLGTELATIINKAIDTNEKNGIKKDDKAYYINNKKDSIKIDIKMITIDKTFEMETIYKKGITDFIHNFNLIKFKCSNIEYHEQTGKVSKIIFEQIEE